MTEPYRGDDPRRFARPGDNPRRFARPGDNSDLDTAPQPAVRMSDVAAGRAAGDVASVLLIRAIVAGTAAVVLLVIAVLLFQHGVRADQFPSYVSGSSTATVIERYSAPWISGAAGVALLAGLCSTSCAVDTFRRVRFQRARRPA